MKKTYVNPVSKVVRVGVAQMMASSPVMKMNLDDSNSNSVDAANVDVHENNGWDIWGTEDESEEY